MTTHTLTAPPLRLSRPFAAKAAYILPTTLLALLMLSGGVLDALRTPETLAVFRSMGYPDYFGLILGVAKALGGLALVLPVPRTLREWAYAGCTFEVLGAISSLLLLGHPLTSLGTPFVALTLIALSYAGWTKRLAAARPW